MALSESSLHQVAVCEIDGVLLSARSEDDSCFEAYVQLTGKKYSSINLNHITSRLFSSDFSAPDSVEGIHLRSEKGTIEHEAAPRQNESHSKESLSSAPENDVSNKAGLAFSLEDNVRNILSFLRGKAELTGLSDFVRKSPIGRCLHFLTSAPVPSPLHPFSLLSWHPRHQVLASGGNNNGDVVLHNYGSKGNFVASLLILEHGTTEASLCTSSSYSARHVSALDWRPNDVGTIAVAYCGVLYLWRFRAFLSSPPACSPPPHISLSLPSSLFPSHAPSSSSTRSVQLSRPRDASCSVLSSSEVLWGKGQSEFDCLSWSPCGRFLAVSSLSSPTFFVFQVATGRLFPLRRSLYSPILSLRWSPNGEYLVTSHENTLVLWETATWTCEKWDLEMHCITEVSWSPSSSLFLAVFQPNSSKPRSLNSKPLTSKSVYSEPGSRSLKPSSELGGNVGRKKPKSSIGAFHLTRAPPSLDMHLLPLELSGLSSIGLLNTPYTFERENVSLESDYSFDRIAWDSSGERLVIALTIYERKEENGREVGCTAGIGEVVGNETSKKLLALFRTRHSPIVTADFIGFIHGPSSSFPLSFQFHPSCTFGSLLAVNWSNGESCAYPMCR